MKLLQLDNLFFIKKVVNVQKAEPKNEEESPIKQFVNELYNGSRETEQSQIAVTDSVYKS